MRVSPGVDAPTPGDAQAEDLLAAAWALSYDDSARCAELALAAHQRAQSVGDKALAGLAQVLATLAEVQHGPKKATQKRLLLLRKELLAAGAERGVWLCDDLLANLDMRLGDPAAARARLSANDARPPASRGLHERRQTVWLSQMLAFHDHDFNTLVPLGHRHLALARATGVPTLEGLALMGLAATHMAVMDFESALVLHEQSVQRLTVSASREARAHAYANAVYACYCSGQPQRATQVLQQWERDGGTPDGSDTEAGTYKVPQALAMLAAGALAEAEATLGSTPPARWIDQHHRVAWHWARGWLLLRQGHGEAAEAICRQVMQDAALMAAVVPLNQVQLHEVIRCAAEARGDYRTALEAAKAVRRIELPLLQAHARVRYLSLQFQLHTGSGGSAGNTDKDRRRLQVLERAIAAHDSDWSFSVAEPVDEAAPDAQAQTRHYVALVSHELRTPLSGLIGLTELLLRSPLDAQQQRLVTLARTSAHSMMRLLGDILDIAKLEAGQFQLSLQPFSMHELVQEMAALFEPLARQRQLGFGIDMDAALPPRLLGDPHRLRQVLGNLLSNALKFTPRGEVRLAVRCSDAADPRTVRLEVSDTGQGISAELRARLFSEFAQGAPAMTDSAPGTGLGLAISRQLVTAMGGRIDALAPPGGGSVFWLELALPVAAPAAAPVAG